MPKILCLGSSCKDIFFPTSEGKIIETPNELTSQKKIAFELGAKYKIENIYESLGGCTANVAVGLSRLMVKSSCLSTIGTDEVGKEIIKKLEKEKVDVKDVLKQEGKSDLSMILVDSNSSERTIFSNKNSSGELKINTKKLKGFDWIFLGDIHGKWKEQIESIIELAIKEKKKIAFNPREIHIHEDPAEIIEAISLCEIVFVNKDEAIEIVSNMHLDISLEKLNDEIFILEKLASLEPKVMVLTDGKNGAWVASEGKKYFIKSLEIQAVDSTGAGDAFSSGFLAAYSKGKDIQESLKWGIANSAGVVSYYGAIDGLLKEEEIIKKINDIKVEEI